VGALRVLYFLRLQQNAIRYADTSALGPDAGVLVLDVVHYSVHF
jgi:hypothetical protein